MNNPCQDCILYAICQSRYTEEYNIEIKNHTWNEANDICMVRIASKCNLLADYLVDYIKKREQNADQLYPCLFRMIKL